MTQSFKSKANSETKASPPPRTRTDYRGEIQWALATRTTTGAEPNEKRVHDGTLRKTRGLPWWRGGRKMSREKHNKTRTLQQGANSKHPGRAVTPDSQCNAKKPTKEDRETSR